MTRLTVPPPLPAYPPPLPTAFPEFASPPPLPVREPDLSPLPVRRRRRLLKPPPLPRRPSRTEIELFFAGIEWIFGLFCLVGGLAMLASVPVLNFLSLGYLLEASGRVARSGRLRDGFPDIRLAARLGGIVLASWVFLLPIRLLGDLVYSAEVIDPGGKAATAWQVGLYVLMGLTLLHIVFACARGGKLRYFLWPFNFLWVLIDVFRGDYYTRTRDAVWDFTM